MASKRCIAAMHADISDHEGGELVRSLLQSIGRVEAAFSGVESDSVLLGEVVDGECGREAAEREAIGRARAGWEDAVRRACGRIPPRGWEEEMARMKNEIEACSVALQDLARAHEQAQERLQAALQVGALADRARCRHYVPNLYEAWA